jgi:endoglucanase
MDKKIGKILSAFFIVLSIFLGSRFSSLRKSMRNCFYPSCVVATSEDCSYDYDQNGKINALDFGFLFKNWTGNIDDFITMLAIWGTKCTQVDLPFLRVEGDKIVDESGEEVYLRGIQGLGYYKIDVAWYLKATLERGEDPYKFDQYAADLAQYYYADYDFDEIESTGANIARVFFPLHGIQKRPLIGTTGGPYEYSDASLQLLEDHINQFGQQGIYSILVLSDAGQNDWAEYRQKLNLNLWDKSNGLWDQSVALWGEVAKRFRDNPYVAGYNLINEPSAPSKQELHDLYQDYIDEIRKYDQNHILFLEMDDGPNDFEYQIGGEYDDTNLAVSFHFYLPGKFTLHGDPSDSSTYPGTYGVDDIYFDKKKMEEAFRQYFGLDEFKNKPVYVGEFGAAAYRDENQGGLQWIEDAIDIMNKNGAHYTFHNYKARTSLLGSSYWQMKPEAGEKLNNVLKGLRDGTMEFEQLSPKDKEFLITEKSYQIRSGLKEILIDGF